MNYADEHVCVCTAVCRCTMQVPCSVLHSSAHASLFWAWSVNSNYFVTFY